MKAGAFILYFSLLFGTNAFGQLRHVKGIEGIGFVINKPKTGIGGELSYEKYLSNSIIFKTGGYFEKREIGFSNLYSYGIMPQAYKTVLNNKRNVFIDLNVGINFGYEHAYSNVTDGIAESFVIGERVGLAIEYFITSSLKIEIKACQYYIQRSKFLKYGQLYGIGITYEI